MAQYNRKTKRWEREAICGKVIWSKHSRYRVYYNLDKHYRTCAVCRAKDRVRYIEVRQDRWVNDFGVKNA